ncbi:MAG: hypothetical protein KGL95_09270, partial [Patescibacteria group bacterium]|nr:hypothetical protein [Patescibacteria group bacterium]
LRISLNQKGFMEQSKVNIDSTVTALDYDIMRLRKLQDKLEASITSFTNPFEIIAVCTEIRKIIKTKSELRSQKLTIENTPTADITLARLSQEILKKYDSTLAN